MLISAVGRAYSDSQEAPVPGFAGRYPGNRGNHASYSCPRFLFRYPFVVSFAIVRPW